MHPEVGTIFGRLTVVDARAPAKNKQRMCACVCTCGVRKEVAVSYLVRGLVRSCGCLSRENTGNRARTHGKSKTPEYAVWCRMIARCTNPTVSRYPRYGGRGIKVCERWAAFENFLADMGEMPTRRHSLGRIDNDGDYCPENCRWETIAEQASNTSNNVRVTWNGREQTIAQWARELGISPNRLSQRLRSGIPLGEAISGRKNLALRPIKYGGEELLTTEWMRRLSIPISSFYYFRRQGLSDEQIVEKYAARNSGAH